MSQTGIGDLISEPTTSEDTDTVRFYITNVEYTENGGRPVTHLFGRDGEREYYHAEIFGHRPSLFVREDEFGPQVTNHYAVHSTERYNGDGDRYTDIDGNELVRIFTYLPGQVADLREQFDWSGEADVFYTNRWLIDNEIYTGVEIEVPDRVDDESSDLSPSQTRSQQESQSSTSKGWVSRPEDGVTHVRVDNDAVDSYEYAEEDLGDTIRPKMVVTDIEVAGEEGVPDPSEAHWPVSTIVAWDSYSEEYVGWLLEHEDHPDEYDVSDLGMETRVFESETDMLDDFNRYIEDQQPDMLSGWYSNDFDYPYLINRCRRLDVWSFKDWSPLGNVYTTKYGPAIDGVTAFDMLQGYDKTMRGEYSGKLEDVAQDELDTGKLDVAEGHTEMWKSDPVEFLEYNKVDVELVHRIEQAKGVIDLFMQLRELSGAQFDDCHAPIDMLDVYFLRKAKEYGIRLPTGESPTRSWFYGATVLDPQPGMHTNVFYFDLASLYPNLIKQLNIGPETLVGFEDANDVGTINSYVDTRPVDVKEETEPETEPFYILDPEERESFIRQSTDDVIQLKEPYRGTGMYVAVKMTVNAIWGVLGDADSYGKGFRLFDWKMGESITLAGRKVLKFTRDKAIEKFEERGYDAYAVVGDTDGVGISVTGDQEELLDVAHEIAEEVNEAYADFMADEFGTSENFMEVEVESLAEKLFVPHGATTKTPKKRYAQKFAWDDDKGWDTSETKITGLEYVRSDTAGATNVAQKQFVDEILSRPLGEAQERYYEWLNDFVAYLKGEITVDETEQFDEDDVDDPITMLGRPKGIGQSLDEYGSATDKPQPTYKGAKYANEFIYEGEKISDGDKPYMYYVNEVGGEYPVRFPHDWPTAESGTKVDAVTLDKPEDLPEEIVVDREKMIEKTLEIPLGRMFSPLGWDFDEALSDTDQLDMAEFM